MRCSWKCLSVNSWVALAVEPFHLFRPIARDPPARRLAEPAIQKPGLAFLLVAARPAPERPLAHPEQLRRLLLIELRRFPAVEKIQKPRHAHSLSGFPPAHPDPPKGSRLTGQVVRYLNRTYRVLATFSDISALIALSVGMARFR